MAATKTRQDRDKKEAAHVKLEIRKAVCFTFLAALLALPLHSRADESGGAGPGKIAYLDMQKAIQDTSTGKKAKLDLEKEFNSKKAELEKHEGELKKMDEELRKKAAALSDEARAKKVQELQTEAMKFQREVGESQQNIQKRQSELTRPIIEKLSASIQKLAKDGGYAMVLEKSEQGVLFARKDLDLTDAVVKDYEASLSKK